MILVALVCTLLICLSTEKLMAICHVRCGKCLYHLLVLGEQANSAVREFDFIMDHAYGAQCM